MAYNQKILFVTSFNPDIGKKIEYITSLIDSGQPVFY